MITSSKISLSKIFVSKVIFIQESVHHDVVGILAISESMLSIINIHEQKQMRNILNHVVTNNK